LLVVPCRSPGEHLNADILSPVPPANRRTGGIAFLLAQIGQHAADRFAARIAELDLVLPQAGILRAIAMGPGRSQQALSEQLGLLPSRVVAFVDNLEQRGYVERRRSTEDRRLNALYLTAKGTELMAELGKLGKAHEAEITAGLSHEQREALAETLTAMAARQQLTPGVHPGYKSIGRGPADDSAAG
jgi:DNA-binding MarR family transcriptional regulator